ncbi:MAG TPA: urea ABC transporter permease subunit UrtB [Pseudomonas sp.]|nr:urea ABC transporter permease subunit UrtB [Pseudomonadales bacterium]MAQ49901.1 urea ABC transporter permease subunit UrtB [Pseudomonas sp.]MED5494060.1 urea ABC transporter permease subunit UrtB [Pseudomonadota bacterium]HIQ53306.1 urea ABC transporter permease subunit UrtB [Halopseudomonas pachastrellae]MBB51362.1 urea ABC transporter permease subunit UrtB [Pseudomonadales bacterium]
MGGYSSQELMAIFVMQGFSGLSLFCVFLLMALGLAIIFGQMGVINMAHGEFLTLGAYITWMVSKVATETWPWMQQFYFPLAVVLAFLGTFILGYLVEMLLIRRLYSRPLDTLLATWGLGLIMQQIYRSTFGPREVSVVMPDWLMGSWAPTDIIDIPLNGLFVMGITALMTVLVVILLYRSRWGIKVRATTQNRMMANAAGINTQRVDRFTFALGCGIAGVAGAAFTTIASTGPTTGSLYIVDTFLVVVFGGAASLFGTVVSAFGIAQSQSILEFFLSGSMAKVITLLTVVAILMFRPQGLFASKVRR